MESPGKQVPVPAPVHSRRQKSAGFARRFQPIGSRLPLLITTLLTATVILSSWAGYHVLTRALLTLAGQRAATVSQRIGSALAAPQTHLRLEGTPVSHEAALLHAIIQHTPSTLAAAQSVLDAEVARNPQLLRVELSDAKGAPVLGSGAPLASGGTDVLSVAALRGPVFGPLRASHDSVFTDLRLPILGAAHDTVGVLREFTRLTSDQTSTLLRDLVGSEASLYLGNVAGDVWSDFHRRVPAPPVRPGDVRVGMATESVQPDGSRAIGALASVPGLPWVVWVALPQSAVLAPARTYLVQTAAIALIVIGIGAIGARMLSRRIIAPLADLTRAAEDIAAGNYASRANASDPDEIGRLSAAFNDMAAEIQSAAANRENQAVELEMQQAELEDANHDLHHSASIAQEALREGEESRQRTAAVISGAMDCILTMDHEGRIVDFNPAAERTFGHVAADVIGRMVADVIIPEAYREAHRRGLARYLETGVSRVMGSRLALPALRSNGTEFPAELTLTRIPVAGLPSFTCFLRDVTAQKQLENELRQSQKIEAIGSLASGVAHDFNNILTVILNYGELLLGDPELTDPLRDDVREIMQAGDRAATLTAQLLAFGRRQVLRPTVVDVNEVIRSLSGMLSRVVREDITFDLVLDATVSTILVDRGQFEQVIMNLVVNARDAMPHGGSLAIRTDATAAGVMLEVTDTGAGMDAETRARAFEPFFTTKQVGQGTGLGLSTVYGIVKQSGGTIDVESTPGSGTTFRIVFPAHAGVLETPALASLAPRSAERTGMEVLLVEDDPAVRASITSMLERVGHAVRAVSGGEAALDVLRANDRAWDMVVSDAMMPGMSGPQLARVLHSERPELPMVIVSGYAADAVLGQGQLSPNTVFLQKPFTRDQLVQAMGRAAERIRRSVARGTFPVDTGDSGISSGS